MNDNLDPIPTLTEPLAAPRFEPGVGLSIVVPVYRGAATIGTLVSELSRLRPAGGLEIVLVNDGSPDNSHDVCRALLQTAARAADLYRARAQFRRAQRGDDRPAPYPRRLRDHHGRRPAEPARGSGPPVRPRAER